MNEVIYPNRTVGWVVALLVIFGFVAWWLVILFQLRAQFDFYEGEAEQTEFNIETVTEDETHGWKTYRNEEFGFEFKYPQSWSSNGSEGNYIFIIDRPNEGIAISQIEKTTREEFIKKETQRVDYLHTIFDDTINRGGGSPPSYLQPVDFNGEEAVMQSQEDESGSYIILIIPKFGIQLAYNKSTIDHDVINTLLDSFHFFEPVDTSNWKTESIRKENIEVSFEYPLTWSVYTSEDSATLYDDSRLCEGGCEYGALHDLRFLFIENLDKKSLDSFINDYREGHYTLYNKLQFLAVDGHEAIFVSDADQKVPFRNTFVTLIKIEDYILFAISGDVIKQDMFEKIISTISISN